EARDLPHSDRNPVYPVPLEERPRRLPSKGSLRPPLRTSAPYRPVLPVVLLLVASNDRGGAATLDTVRTFSETGGFKPLVTTLRVDASEHRHPAPPHDPYRDGKTDSLRRAEATSRLRGSGS